ncbi:MAG: hypothetical protein ABL908_05400 [Hyphomicrobium sp.]
MVKRVNLELGASATEWQAPPFTVGRISASPVFFTVSRRSVTTGTTYWSGIVASKDGK